MQATTRENTIPQIAAALNGNLTLAASVEVLHAPPLFSLSLCLFGCERGQLQCVFVCVWGGDVVCVRVCVCERDEM